MSHGHPLGKGWGTLASQGRLLFHSLQYIMEKLPRVAIIENVRGLIFKRNAASLAHVKDCLQALHYSIHQHSDLVHFPVRSSPESRPVLRGGHPRTEGRL